MQELDARWEGPFALGYSRDEGVYEVPELSGDLPQKANLYCIYGRHPIYGPNALLYLGQAKNGSVIARLKDHLRGPFGYYCELSFHLGVLTCGEQVIREPQTISAAGSLLIASNKPALNKEHLHVPADSAGEIHLINRGSAGALVRECSGRYFFCG